MCDQLLKRCVVLSFLILKRIFTVLFNLSNSFILLARLVGPNDLGSDLRGRCIGSSRLTVGVTGDRFGSLLRYDRILLSGRRLDRGSSLFLCFLDSFLHVLGTSERVRESKQTAVERVLDASAERSPFV